MEYGSMLSRSWDLIWNNKFLIGLGVLIALGTGGSGGGGGGNFNPSNFQNTGDFSDFQDVNPDDAGQVFEQMLESGFGIPAEMAAFLISIIAIVVLIVIVVSIVLWVLGTIARGGLISAVHGLEGGIPEAPSPTFGSSFSAGWQRIGRLLGITIIPAIPGIVLGIAVLIGVLALGLGSGALGDSLATAGTGLILCLVSVGCIVALVSLGLSIVSGMAIRAAMLEDRGVFEAYSRGWEVLRENLGEAVILGLIQIGIGIGIALVLLIPGFLLALCPLLWPVLWVINGGISAYFHTLWTLAYRQWTGLENGPAVVDVAPAV